MLKRKYTIVIHKLSTDSTDMSLICQVLCCHALTDRRKPSKGPHMAIFNKSAAVTMCIGQHYIASNKIASGVILSYRGHTVYYSGERTMSSIDRGRTG